MKGMSALICFYYISYRQEVNYFNYLVINQ